MAICGWLAAQQAWFPAIPAEVIIGDKKRGPDYYRALTPDEKYFYTRQTGHEIREQIAERLPDLQAMDPASARGAIEKIAREVHQQANRSWPR